MSTLKSLEDKANAAGDALITSYEKKVQTVLKSALDDIRVTMSKIYEKYASGGVLTRAEMTKYNRMVALEKELISSLSPAIRSTLSVMKTMPPEVYNEAFFRYGYAIDASQEIRVNWGLLNKEAVAAELANPFSTIARNGWTQRARIMIRKALNSGLSVGKSYTDMARDLKKGMNETLWEALRIIRTEGQYALNAGSSKAYSRAREEGIEGVRVWSATLDGATRDSHAAMDGRTEDKDGQFTLPDGETTPYPAWEGLSAGERIQCIPGDSLPIAIDTTRIYKRWYDGDLIRIQTRNGLNFRVTPNHPVLTEHGWIPANILTKGIYIVSVDYGKIGNISNRNIKDSPSIISKVFNLFRIIGVNDTSSGFDSQFHGDGRNADVNIISVNRHLWNSFQSSFNKPRIKYGLALSNILHSFLARYCPLNKLIFASLFTAHRIMSGLRKIHSFIFSSFRHSNIHGIGSTSRGDVILDEYSSDDLSTYPDIRSEQFFGHSGSVVLDNIVDIRKEYFSGHIYNLQTDSGYYGLYNGNGRVSIVHNCRCRTRFEVQGIAPKYRRSREDGVIPYQTYGEWYEWKSGWK